MHWRHLDPVVLDHKTEELSVRLLQLVDHKFSFTNATTLHRLAAVNFFLGCVGTVQVGRILFYRRSVKGSTVAEEVNGTTEETIDGAKGADKSVAVARNATE
jgi:hypothetical protein